jgi:glycine/D-amino acid oxidase-like deaminating enzyme
LRRKTAIVVGAGVVGLATAYWLRDEGVAVRVVDRDLGGDKASFRNAAGIAVTQIVPVSVPSLAWWVPGWPLEPLTVRPRHALHRIHWLWRFARAGRPSEVARIGNALAALNPATPDSLPVIGASPRSNNAFYAFGHGNLGLTQAATTGRLIGDLVTGREPQRLGALRNFTLQLAERN